MFFLLWDKHLAMSFSFFEVLGSYNISYVTRGTFECCYQDFITLDLAAVVDVVAPAVPVVVGVDVEVPDVFYPVASLFAAVGHVVLGSAPLVGEHGGFVLKHFLVVENPGLFHSTSMFSCLLVCIA